MKNTYQILLFILWYKLRSLLPPPTHPPCPPSPPTIEHRFPEELSLPPQISNFFIDQGICSMFNSCLVFTSNAIKLPSLMEKENGSTGPKHHLLSGGFFPSPFSTKFPLFSCFLFAVLLCFFSS